jgi:arginine-tRNA-protein transferase
LLEDEDANYAPPTHPAEQALAITSEFV